MTIDLSGRKATPNPYLTPESSESSTAGPREPWLDTGAAERTDMGELYEC